MGLLLFLFMPFVASASEEEEPFNAKEAIFEHLLDNYGWEIPFSHSRMALPVIVRDIKESGLFLILNVWKVEILMMDILSLKTGIIKVKS